MSPTITRAEALSIVDRVAASIGLRTNTQEQRDSIADQLATYLAETFTPDSHLESSIAYHQLDSIVRAVEDKRGIPADTKDIIVIIGEFVTAWIGEMAGNLMSARCLHGVSCSPTR